jgi:hypothetical protein
MPFWELGGDRLDTGGVGVGLEVGADKDDLELVVGTTAGTGFVEGRTTTSVVG